MSTSAALLCSIFLLLGNAYFVAAEFAVTSSRLSKVEPLINTGNRRARTVAWALQNISLMLTVCQLGVTVCSIGLGALAEPALAHLFMPLFSAWDLPLALAHGLALTGALIIVIYLHVVFGEMLPKNLTITYPETLALYLVPPLVAISRPVRPFISMVNRFANICVRALGLQPRSSANTAFTVEEVAAIITRSQAEGALHDDLGLLSEVIKFSDRKAGLAQVELSKIVALPANVTPEEVEEAAVKTGFSRFPLYEAQNPAQLVGYIHLKDVLSASQSARNKPIPSWRMRRLGQVSAGLDLEDVLRIMQGSGVHVAEVLENGRVTGLLFLEDILEEIVGEIRASGEKSP